MIKKVKSLIVFSILSSYVFAQYHIIGLGSPIHLFDNVTTVDLSEYVLYPELIDTIYAESSLQLMRTNVKTLEIRKTKSISPISFLNIEVLGKTEQILIKNSSRISYFFALNDSNYTDVKLIGDMNNWDIQTSSCNLDGSRWTFIKELVPGLYRYTYIINGVMRPDPSHQDKLPDGHGGVQSFMKTRHKKKAEIPFLYTKSINKNEITLSYSSPILTTKALYDNSKITVSITQAKKEIVVPVKTNMPGRHHVRVWVANNEGISNEVLIPLEGIQVITDSKQLNRNDVQASIACYVDLNIISQSCKYQKQQAQPALICLREQIKSGYFDSIGVNTLVLSPTNVKHGVIQGFNVVNPEYGLIEHLQSCIYFAHHQKCNVYVEQTLDKLAQQHPFVKASANCDNKQQMDIADAVIQLGCDTLASMIRDSIVQALKFNKADGLIFNDLECLPNTFFKGLQMAIKKEIIIKDKQSIKILSNLKPCMQARDIANGKLNSAVDTTFSKIILETLRDPRFSFAHLQQWISQYLTDFGNNHTQILAIQNNSLAFKQREDKDLASKLLLHQAIMMFMPGVPRFEQGFENGLDNMGSSKREKNMIAYAAAWRELLHLRKQNIAMTYGSFRIIEATHDVFVIERRYFDDCVYLFVNKSKEAKEFQMGFDQLHQFKSLSDVRLKNAENKLQLKVVPYSCEILIKTKT